MKVFIFDLLPYGKHFDQYKASKYLPYPLPSDHYDREIAARTYEQHLQIWEEMDKLGFDGVGLNEHHTTPHGLMNSPNMMAAVGGAAHQEAQVPDARQPRAAAQPAAHRRRAGDGRHHVARAHSVRLRPRRAARIQRLWRVDGRIARALRGGGRHHPEGVDRAEVLPRGQVLVVQGHRDLAAALPAAASAGVGAVHRLEGNHRVGRQAQFQRGAFPIITAG